MLIRNAMVFNDEGTFKENDIHIKDDIIEYIGTFNGTDENVIDATGLYAIPGLIDIHFHGAIGHDLCDADSNSLKEILDYELSQGIMAVCPATMTAPEEKLSKIIDTALLSKNYRDGADLVGLNLEGPFINPKKAAAQNSEYIISGDAKLLRRLIDRGQGLIKLVDVAPEISENMYLIDTFKDEVSFSLAHTFADYDISKEAFCHGAKQLTHMFNAMNDITHRAPGPVLAALEAEAYVELIADGIHNHDAIIRMVFKLFDESKIILISDSMMATGFEDGLYTLGGQDVLVRGHECRLANHLETLAGSNTTLFDCLKHAVLFAGIPIEKAIFAASRNPARAILIDDKYGSIRKGCYGNIILMDDDFNIKFIIKNGMTIKSS